MDLKTVVKHLVNGSLGDELCVVCLLPLTGDNCENVWTSICKIDEEYRIADVLREICQLKILDTDHYNICCGCFQSASEAYKFYLQAKRSHQILEFYTDQLLNNFEDLEFTKDDCKRSLCIPLPVFTPEVAEFDYDFDSVGIKAMGDDDETIETADFSTDEEVVDDQTLLYSDPDDPLGEIELKKESDDEHKIVIKKTRKKRDRMISASCSDEEVVMVVNDDQTLLYSIQDDASQAIQSEVKTESNDENILIVNKKARKKRDPLTYVSCLHCPVKYRFLLRLKKHAKKMHNADIYYCKICKHITDKKEDYEEHLLTHIGKYQCFYCCAVYKKKSALILHMRCHNGQKKEKKPPRVKTMICEICGILVENVSALDDHYAMRHVNRFTCFYCGKTYVHRIGFEKHIKKHEKYLKSSKQSKNQESKSTSPEPQESSSKRCICGICGNSFVDDRSLMWHKQLHNNDRPFKCDECGRAFVSANRRNQHHICAHSLPSLRCPLCPGLFHLRSLVSAHLKKVHLNRNYKRRTRTRKPQVDVFWRTETVPIRELSVAIQDEVLELKSAQDQRCWDNFSTKQPQE